MDEVTITGLVLLGACLLLGSPILAIVAFARSRRVDQLISALDDLKRLCDRWPRDRLDHLPKCRNLHHWWHRRKCRSPSQRSKKSRRRERSVRQRFHLKPCLLMRHLLRRAMRCWAWSF